MEKIQVPVPARQGEGGQRTPARKRFRKRPDQMGQKTVL